MTGVASILVCLIIGAAGASAALWYAGTHPEERFRRRWTRAIGLQLLVLAIGFAFIVAYRWLTGTLSS